MKNLIIWMLFISIVSGDELTQDEINEQTKGMEKWSNYADQAKNLAADQAMEELGLGLRKMANKSIYSIEGANEVAEKLKVTALSIPGHATYYKNKIEAMRAQILANEKLTPEEIREHQEQVFRGLKEPLLHEAEYNTSTTYALSTLKYLPSAETVAVLGHFLNDPEGRDGKSVTGKKRGSYDVSPPPTIAEQALGAIANLGIENPPVKVKGIQDSLGYYSPEEIDAWKDWWNEIAAGKRTYRFIGSPVEYGPDGPVSKEKLERIRLSEKRDEERKAGKSHKRGETEASRPAAGVRVVPLVSILASTLLCGGAVWYFLKNRKRG